MVVYAGNPVSGIWRWTKYLTIRCHQKHVPIFWGLRDQWGGSKKRFNRDLLMMIYGLIALQRRTTHSFGKMWHTEFSVWILQWFSWLRSVVFWPGILNIATLPDVFQRLEQHRFNKHLHTETNITHNKTWFVWFTSPWIDQICILYSIYFSVSMFICFWKSFLYPKSINPWVFSTSGAYRARDIWVPWSAVMQQSEATTAVGVLRSRKVAWDFLPNDSERQIIATLGEVTSNGGLQQNLNWGLGILPRMMAD